MVCIRLILFVRVWSRQILPDLDKIRCFQWVFINKPTDFLFRYYAQKGKLCHGFVGEHYLEPKKQRGFDDAAQLSPHSKSLVSHFCWPWRTSTPTGSCPSQPRAFGWFKHRKSLSITTVCRNLASTSWTTSSFCFPLMYEVYHFTVSYIPVDWSDWTAISQYGHHGSWIITLHIKRRRAPHTWDLMSLPRLCGISWRSLQMKLNLPVVPHKAVAEVSKIGNL